MLLVSLIGAAIFFGVIAISLLKARVWHGLIGFFIFPLAIYAASRIGKPSSAWPPLRRAQRPSRRRPSSASRPTAAPSGSRRVRTALGGSTEEEYEAKVARRG